MGRSMKRTLQRRQVTPTEVSVGCKEEPTRSIVGEGRGLGEEAGESTRVSSRRTGGGTCGRNVGPKQGTCRWRPRGKDPLYNRWKPGSERELSRGADRVVVARTWADNTTPTEQRTRGLARFQPAVPGPDMPQGQPDSSGVLVGWNEGCVKREFPGRAYLTVGRASLKPYWGKPDVRNFRGG